MTALVVIGTSGNVLCEAVPRAKVSMLKRSFEKVKSTIQVVRAVASQNAKVWNVCKRFGEALMQEQAITSLSILLVQANQIRRSYWK